MIYIDLILNLSLLVALSIISGFIEKHLRNHPQWKNLIQGFLFGGAAVLGMLRPLHLGPGLIFDGRSVMVSLCTMFFGPWSALVAGSMTIACRIELGGMGSVIGVMVILSSLGIGLLAYFRLKPQNAPPTIWTLYLFGIAVHIAMLALMFYLPGGAGLTVLKKIGLPVIILYPLATVLAGKLLSDQLETRQNIMALQESEKQYRLLVETANEGIWAMDGDHRTTFVNQAMADMIGYQPSEMIGKKVEDFFFPEDMTFHEQRMQKRHAGKDEMYERRFKKRDGTPLWTNASAKAMQDSQGRFIGSFAMFTDISERKKTEENLLKSRADLNALFDAVNESIFLMEPDGTVVALNKTTATRLGLDNTDVTGRNMFDFLPTDVAEKRRAYVEQIITTGKPERFEDQRDGKWIDNSIFPIMDENGRVRRLAIFGLDITRHKLGEEALQKSEERVRTKLEAILSPEGDIGSLNLADIIDVPSIQAIMDDFFSITHITVALLDINGRVLVAAGWQDICTKFHRIHPETNQNCIESDTLLSSGIQPGTFKIYKCKNNLRDIATPIIIGNRHLGNLFLGQFFFEDDMPDIETFRFQAGKFGFNEDEYLDALSRVPRWRRETIDCAMRFCIRLAGMISSLSYSNLNLARILEQNRQIKEKLEQQKKMLQTIIDQSHTSLVYLDPEFNFVAVNNIYAQSCRRTPEELIGKNHFHFYPHEENQTIFKKARDTGQVVSFHDKPFTFPDQPERGTTYWDWTLTPIKGRSDTVEGLVFSLTETTERKRAEELLRQSEETHRAIIEGIPDIVMRFDQKGRYLFVSKNVEKITEIPATEFTGKTHQELGFPKELCRFWDQTIRGVFDSGISLETEFTFEGTQEQKNFNWRLIPEFDRSGAVHSILSLSRDITSHRKAEQDYKILFQEMMNGFALHEIILDLQGQPVDYRFLAINPAFERMTGLKANDIIGKTALEIMPGIERHWIVTYGQVALTGVPIFFENYAKELNKHFEVSSFCPAPKQFACIIADITSRKNLEDQLRHAQKMESVGRLAGGVAHDFNNMLMIIIGNTEIAMEETSPSAPVYANLKEIITSAQRSAELTRQLLAFARKQTISLKVLNLNELISSMIKMLQRLIGEDIDLIWKPSSRLWPVRMDPSQIDQILVNLAVNARDAINGVGTLTIETGNILFDETYCMTHAGFIPGEYVLMAASDTGCGMEKETLTHLFEPFYTTKEMGKGTGLGLATIYGIVKQNDGFINVYSEPGKGTTFKIYLPRTKAMDAVELREVSQKPANGTETVLLVEDELSILKLGKAVLDRYGYTVLSARSPKEAMALAEQHPGPIHLLITDIVMPQMNGRELMKKITLSRPEIKTLYMSGYTADVIEHHGVLEKGIHFLQKPFSVKTIAAKVREVLDDSDITT